MASILLMNSSFQNRGDALMNRAIQEKLGPSHSWSVSGEIAFLNRSDTRQFKAALLSDLSGRTLKQRLFNSAVSTGAAIAGLLPARLRRAGKFLISEDIDIAFDVSGYCFGDPWGQERVDRARRNYRRLRKAGARIVLMPKTWGPFTRIESVSLDRMFDEIDIAFARDERSLGLIAAQIGSANRSKLHFAPDYTHAVAPAPAEPVEEKIAYLIPSTRVIDSGTLSRDRYLELFARAREQFRAAGFKPMLLIHETANDMAFVDAASQMGFDADGVVVPADAIQAKTLISQASAVVTSRLHGLYNALNSSVPVAVVAWSFKYEEALKQYGCPECAADMSDAEGSLPSLIRMITDDSRSAELRKRMLEGKRLQERRTQFMWDEIIAITGLGDHP